MATFDYDLSSEEDLDNFANDHEVDQDVDESSSDNDKMRKTLKIGKKRDRRAQLEDQHVNDLTENICEDESGRRKLVFTNNKSTTEKQRGAQKLEFDEIKII